MRIIPAIDLIDGKCVRLVKGDYARQTTYHEDPVEVAKSFEDAGLKYLHLVDLDGAKAKHIVNWRVLERITAQTQLTVDFGGGIKSNQDIQTAFACGAAQVTGGSIAANDPEVFLGWLRQYGPDQLILGADAKDGMIATHGWQETTSLEVTQFISEYAAMGLQNVICTDIAKDGMLQGPSFGLYKSILTQTPGLNLIASGGVTTLEDLVKLKGMGMEGAIIGKAIYEGRITLKELESKTHYPRRAKVAGSCLPSLLLVPDP